MNVHVCVWDCCHVSISVSFTYLRRACLLLLSQQETISITSFNQVHGLGSVGEVATFCHHRQDGHLSPDIATLALTVNDQHCHWVPTLLHLRTKHTVGINTCSNLQSNKPHKLLTEETGFIQFCWEWSVWALTPWLHWSKSVCLQCKHQLSLLDHQSLCSQCTGPYDLVTHQYY